ATGESGAERVAERIAGDPALSHRSDRGAQDGERRHVGGHEDDEPCNGTLGVVPQILRGATLQSETNLGGLVQLEVPRLCGDVALVNFRPGAEPGEPRGCR